MKKIPALLMLLVIGFACPLTADEDAPATPDLLVTLSRQLNRLESRYWAAVVMDQDGEFHKETRDLIRDTVSTGRQIQTLLSKSDYKGVANITPSLSTLQKVFDEARIKQDKKWRLSLKETSMSEYARRFRQLPENKGKGSKIYPTLANVNIVDYELWLDDITVDNLKKVRVGSTPEAIRDNAPTRERVGQYAEAIKKLRIAMVKLRQESGIDFNPKPKVLQ